MFIRTVTVRGGSIELSHTWGVGATTIEDGESKGLGITVPYLFELN